MPKITDTPPDHVAAEINALRQALDEVIPRKELDRNLIIGTWNIRGFGGLTEKWAADDDDSPKRDLHSLACIAEILDRFDVVAVQEVRGNLKALRHALKYLGNHWGLVLTDVTRGDAGNDERLAFLFDTRRVQMSGLACELVLPKDSEWAIGEGAEQRQFARTPYAVSFRSEGRTFILVTLHVLYGDGPEDRVGELEAIAGWLADWASSTNAYGQNIICLGDFNIDRNDDELYRAFISTGLVTPDALNNVPRTIFSDEDEPESGKHYDQVAWFEDDDGKPVLSFTPNAFGTFNFIEHTLRARGLSKNSLSWRISDHFPLWAEFLL